MPQIHIHMLAQSGQRHQSGKISNAVAPRAGAFQFERLTPSGSTWTADAIRSDRPQNCRGQLFFPTKNA